MYDIRKVYITTMSIWTSYSIMIIIFCITVLIFNFDDITKDIPYTYIIISLLLHSMFWVCVGTILYKFYRNKNARNIIIANAIIFIVILIITKMVIVSFEAYGYHGKSAFFYSFLPLMMTIWVYPTFRFKKKQAQ